MAEQGAKDPPDAVPPRLGPYGELVLRHHDDAFEIISDGVFLMDTRDGRSERQLVRLGLDALDACDRNGPRRVLLAGLGVGFSLGEALSDPRVEGVEVIEWAIQVVEWCRSTVGRVTGGNLDDPRVRCRLDDVVAWLQRVDTQRFDLVCLDVDNGPHWTVAPTNAWLYTDGGLQAIRGRLVPGGVATFWSAEHVHPFERRLRRHFAGVRRFEVEVARGDPDVIYLAQTERVR